MPDSIAIKSEIEATFGFVPPFFEPAFDCLHVLENLWHQTLSAYVENPFSALFKERLNALLSRFCASPYCMMVHSSALRPLGMSAREVLALLDVPVAASEDFQPMVGVIPTPSASDAASPLPDTPFEKTLIACATEVFLNRHVESSSTELRRLLGPDLYPHLIAYIGYIRTCHIWMEAHPNVAFEADKRAEDNLGSLINDEPALADFFLHYQERVAAVYAGRAAEAAVNAMRASIAEREHRIAEELQAALQPDLPDTIPGLSVVKYYEASLTDQASVGGDFYDVFS